MPNSKVVASTAAHNWHQKVVGTKSGYTRMTRRAAAPALRYNIRLFSGAGQECGAAAAESQVFLAVAA